MNSVKDAQRFFLEKVREHVEPPAMALPMQRFLDPRPRTFRQNPFENHMSAPALERKAFLPDVSRVKKDFERFRSNNVREESICTRAARRPGRAPRSDAAPIRDPRI